MVSGVVSVQETGVVSATRLRLVSLIWNHARNKTPCRGGCTSGCMRTAYSSLTRGRRVSRPKTLVDHLVSAGVEIDSIYCDRFVLGELTDAVAGRWPIVPRVTRWSEASNDIAGFRALVKDGPLSITAESKALARLGMSQAKVAGDDQGECTAAERNGMGAHVMTLPLRASWQLARMRG